MRKPFIMFAFFGTLLAVAGCAVTPGQVATTAGAASTVGATYATPAVLTKGQEFCADATADGPLIVAIANRSGVPVTVTGLASAAVAGACAAWKPAAIVVSPPPATQAVPVVAVAGIS